uniref:NADH dehydrogenase [ubiquinone] 1 alpha subcomplex subunit 12 n=1 Tax=Rhodosorus marinus TaxID=101924 RepID=A0A7S3A0X4_9RHOD|mmetsp:Transcript_40550/g.160858  ORF Transcript_40550/g.160858 Transcript_40550/m.160858 type:complete len:162 (+) Transcript_40550:223-708(+)|eukprot:CAMPEP_0113971680 /NCGR_PEP_ID=MMETSP0011_2-20120614/12542_1 /TAXON_ID=101924 /ORGANISM="Rhodosorus marinus" /LENGTH=161 /DNA_ID=CAMNT_0000987545 /DNA_START=249 /DNA_END=734 /DNA_ORIENTATION=- /assembly_acc=CAM_ASM_000156
MARFLRRVTGMVQDARERGFWSTVDALKYGRLGSAEYLVGVDEVGNRYYENPNAIIGRERWVEYYGIEKKTGTDALKIPAEWHMWVHRMVDEPPSRRPVEHPKYQGEIEGNLSGTKDAYYSQYYVKSKDFVGRAGSKIEPWNPSQKRKPLLGPEKDVLDLK